MCNTLIIEYKCDRIEILTQNISELSQVTHLIMSCELIMCSISDGPPLSLRPHTVI